MVNFSLKILLSQPKRPFGSPWAPTFFLCPRIDGAGDIRKDERREGRADDGGDVDGLRVQGS